MSSIGVGRMSHEAWFEDGDEVGFVSMGQEGYFSTYGGVEVDIGCVEAFIRVHYPSWHMMVLGVRQVEVWKGFTRGRRQK
jgi:hypothetical protein